MKFSIGDYPKNVKQAVKSFWKSRATASRKQKASGKADQGNRSAVTGGKNMDAFACLLEALVKKNGLKSATVHRDKALSLPG